MSGSRRGSRSIPKLAGDLGIDLLLGAQVLVGFGVEADGGLTPLERVLAEDLHPPVVDLDNVVAGTGVAPEAEGRGGPRVYDEHVLQPPSVGYVLVSGEDEIHTNLYEPLQDVPGVVNDVPLAPGAWQRDQVVVDDEYLEFVPSLREGAADKLVVLSTHLPVVEVRLGGVDAHQDHVVKVYDRLTLSEEPLEVDVADVPCVMVAGDDYDMLALNPTDVLGGLFELFAVPRVGEIPGHHDGRRVQTVYLDYRSVQKFWNKARVTAMDVAYLAYGQPAVTH